jgi:hypothetical protein
MNDGPTGQDGNEAPQEISKPWQAVYDTLPDSFISLIEPELEKAFGDLQSENAKYEPYKDLVGQYKPEELSNSVAFAQALQQDPEGTFKSLAQFLQEKGVDPKTVLGIDAPEAPSSPNAGNANPVVDEEDEDVDPHVKALSSKVDGLIENFQKLGNYIVDKDNYEKTLKQEQEYADYLGQIKSLAEERELPFDKDYVEYRLSVGRTGEQALEDYKELLVKNGVTSIGGKKQNDAPVVIGAGSLPSNQKSVTDLSEKELEDFMVSYIESQKQSSS